MATFFPRASSSRIGANKVLNYTGSGVVTTTGVSVGVYQVRVLSQIAGFVAIDTAAASTGVGALVAANTATGDYFACIPGNIVTFSSTLGTSGTLSVTEML